MKKIFLAVFLFFFLSLPVYAKSTATVEVNSNVSGSRTSNIKTHTNITVETNGKTTTYSSDKPENIEVKSVNGKSEIKVNGVSVSSSPGQPTSEPTTNPSVKPTDQPEDEDDERDQRNIFDIFEDIFKKIFFLFS